MTYGTPSGDRTGVNYPAWAVLAVVIATGVVLVPFFGAESPIESLAMIGFLMAPLVVLGLGLETVRYTLETRFGCETDLERGANLVITSIGATAAFSAGALLTESPLLLAIGVLLWGFVAGWVALRRL